VGAGVPAVLERGQQFVDAGFSCSRPTRSAATGRRRSRTYVSISSPPSVWSSSWVVVPHPEGWERRRAEVRRRGSHSRACGGTGGIGSRQLSLDAAWGCSSVALATFHELPTYALRQHDRRGIPDPLARRMAASRTCAVQRRRRTQDRASRRGHSVNARYAIEETFGACTCVPVCTPQSS
jgi:hypothetical protein